MPVSDSPKVVRLSSTKREKTPATHAWCDACEAIRPVNAEAFQSPADVLYEAVQLTCDRCKYSVAELYRRRGANE